MLLYELLRRAGLFYRAVGDENIEISGISSDSRRVEKGNIFVCIRGRKYNSHKMASEAIARGAVAVVAEEEIAYSPGTTLLYTQNTTAALSQLWDAWYLHPSRDLKLIAVTGTNGKTTTSFMLEWIFRTALFRCGIIGTVMARTPKRIIETDERLPSMTTPDPERLYHLLYEMKKDGAEYVFMEVSSHALDQGRVAPLKFDSAIFTNLTPEHLDYHGNMESYFLSKATLLGATKTALINLDDPYFDRYVAYKRARNLDCRIVSYSANGKREADYRAEKIKTCNDSGISYTLRSIKHVWEITSPIPGSFTVENTLAAGALAAELGIKGNAIIDALASFGGAPGRMQRVILPPSVALSVYIDYAHTPDALKKLLLSAREFTPECKRLWVLFGCGGERDRSKRPLMGRIASTLADVCIITSDNSRGELAEDIISEILRGVDASKDHAVIPSRRSAIEYAVQNADSGDVLILAGKGHEQYEIRADGRHTFNEEEIVRNALKYRRS